MVEREQRLLDERWAHEASTKEPRRLEFFDKHVSVEEFKNMYMAEKARRMAEGEYGYGYGYADSDEEEEEEDEMEGSNGEDEVSLYFPFGVDVYDCLRSPVASLCWFFWQCVRVFSRWGRLCCQSWVRDVERVCVCVCGSQPGVCACAIANENTRAHVCKTCQFLTRTIAPMQQPPGRPTYCRGASYTGAASFQSRRLSRGRRRLCTSSAREGKGAWARGRRPPWTTMMT